MDQLKNAIKNTPLISIKYNILPNGDRALRKIFNPLNKKSTEDIFTDIYKTNAWSGIQPASRPGSDPNQTRILISELQTLFEDINISTMLDIPCGDFQWMKNVDLSNVEYIGADIINELIQTNDRKFSKKGIKFQQLNLIQDKLPRVDLVLCRDCLVHLSLTDNFLALSNICKSNSKYLLTTIFTDRKENRDIITGQWHPLHLAREPFSLPQPIKLINEGCMEGDGAYKDKSLGLWEIAEIRDSIKK